MTKLILDYSKWRCGGDGGHKHGLGVTRLLNGLGYMCCLGQWCEQRGVKKDDLIDKRNPGDLFVLVPGFNEESFCTPDPYIYTPFSRDAMMINDLESMTPYEKIEGLKSLCAEYGFELEVINMPA